VLQRIGEIAICSKTAAEINERLNLSWLYRPLLIYNQRVRPTPENIHDLFLVRNHEISFFPDAAY
jgi:hypothetical protein